MFEGVKFSYPLKPNDPVMKNLQFSASRGQTVALVGPSGCGKSTAIALLERFYDPKGGFVVLNYYFSEKTLESGLFHFSYLY